MKTTLIKNLKKSLFLLSAAVILFTGCKTGSDDDKTVIPTATTGNFEAADDSVTMASNMAIGWNLGNALDASDCGDWAYNEGLKLEYSWLPHKQATSDNLIKTIRGSNFKTIRIPISWHNHMSKTDGEYKIDSAWMARVKHLVDLSLEEGMCVIINIHHDNLTVISDDDAPLKDDEAVSEIDSNPGFALSKNAAVQTKSKAYIKAVWEQISETFKDYDNKLVFELLNEPRCVGTSFEWGLDSEQEATYSAIIKDYEQVALDAIRASGGKNATRYVMVPCYAASPSWAKPEYFPTDSATDRLLLSAHAYTPSYFCLDGPWTDYDAQKSAIESGIDSTISGLKSAFVDKGIGVVIGEASASDKDNLASRIKWAKYYFTKTQKAGIPVVLWDNEQAVAFGSAVGGENHGYFHRVTCVSTWPTLIKTMMDIVYGEGNSGTTVTPGSGAGDDDGDAVSDPIIVADFSKESDGNNITLPQWGYTATYVDDATYGKVLNLDASAINPSAEKDAGTYSNLTVSFATPINIAGKKLYVVIKGDSSSCNTGDGVMKFTVYSSEDPQNASELNSILPTSASEFQTLSGDIDDMWASWDNSLNKNGKAADLTKITTLKIQFQLSDYDMQIAKIYIQ